MKPSDLSKTLRQIAAKIDASKRPDRILVSRDLKRILAAMTRTATDQSEILTQDTVVSFYVDPDSDLAEDTDGTLGVPFTELLDTVASDVDWSTNSVSMTLKQGPDKLRALARDIMLGNHGVEMMLCIKSLENPGNIENANPGSNDEYYLF